MSGLEVSRVVASILSAFNNGMDLFRKMRKGQSKKRGKAELQSPFEIDLQKSLQQRPRDIQAGYSKSVTKLGYRFEIGDTLAQTSLAHTLLVLNTGLINILNTALSEDTKARDFSKRSLLSLSETAATDALYTLSQLDVRLSSPRLSSRSQLMLPAPSSSPRQDQRVAVEQKVKHDVASKAARKVIEGKKSAPLLVRGGWIKPKSSFPSASSASASNTNLARPSHLRSKSSPAVPKAADKRSSPSPFSGKDHMQSQTQITTPFSPPERPQHRRTKSTPRPHREPSMLLVPSDFFKSLDVLQDEDPNTPQAFSPSGPPPIPPKIPLHSRPTNFQPPPQGLNHGTRVRPPSVATFMTASTKIGEIPEHRWPHQHPRRQLPWNSDHPAQAEQENRPPLPYTVPPALNPADVERMQNRSKGSSWGFKLWKRKDDRAAAAAAGASRNGAGGVLAY